MSSSRKRNMLEAFQASAREASEEVEPTTAATGGPFAEGEQAETPPDPEPPRMDEMPKVGLNEVLGTAPLQKLLVAQLVLLVGAFYLGYLAGSPVEAAGPTDTGSTGRTSQEPGPVSSNPNENGAQRPTNDGPTSGGMNAGTSSPYDNAFFNVENTATLRVASYSKNSRNTKLAWEVYDYLIAQGMPAVTPVATTQNIFMFVGASPSIDGLADIKARVQALEGPSGGFPFADAYEVNIDDYKKR